MRLTWRLPVLLVALILILFFGFVPIYGVNWAEPAIDWRPDGSAFISPVNKATPDWIKGPATVTDLQVGDAVLSTPGGPLRRWDFYFPWGITAGNPSRWVLQRGDVVYAAVFEYRAPSASEQARLSLRPLVALLAWAFGAVLLLRASVHRSVAHRVGWVAIGFAVLLVAAFAETWVTPLSYVTVGLLVPLTSAAYLDLALVSDYEGQMPSVRPGWRWLLYGPAIGLAALAVIDAVALQPTQALDTLTPLHLEDLEFDLLTLTFLLVPAILILRAVLERRPRPRAQLRVIAAGTVLGIGPTVMLVITRITVGSLFSDVYLVTLPMIALIPLSYCYAALRHQYLELDRVAQRALGQIMALFATWLFYALAVVAAQGLVPAPQAALPIGLVSGLLAVTLVYQNQDQVQALTRRLVFGSSENAAVLATRLTTPFRTATRRARVEQALTEDVCQELGLSQAWLVLAPTGEREAVVAWPDPRSPDPGSPDHGSPDHARDLSHRLAPVTRAWIAGASNEPAPLSDLPWVRVVAPVGTQAMTFRGWLLLGAKLNDTSYHARDLAVIEIVADEAAVRLDNLWQAEAARRATARQLLRELRVKRILMNLLHAAPVQYARELREGLQDLMTRPLITAESLLLATEDARSLEESLRNVMGVLGSRLLHLGLPFVLEDVVDRFGATYPRIATRAQIDIRQAESIPTLVSMVVFQGVQEALLNVARHARAEQAVLSATHHDGRLVVTVDDDGVGLPDDFDLSRLLAQGHDGLAGLIELVRTCGGHGHLERSPLGGLRVSLAFTDDDLRAIAEEDLGDLVGSEPVVAVPALV